MSTQNTGGQATLVPQDTRVGNDVPVQTRSERFASGNVEDYASVTGREPEWKLSPVAKLTPLLEGQLEGGRYDISTTDVEGFATSWVAPELSPRGVAGIPEDRAAANAWSSTSEVLVVDIAGEHPEPLRLGRSVLGTTARAAHTIVRVHPNAHATLIMESTGDAVLAENVEFDIQDGASVQIVCVQDWRPGAIHYGAHFARVAKDATFTQILVSVGGDVVIVNPSTQLVGAGAAGHLWGAYFADASQHLEHRVYVHHQGPHTVSRVTYKGALHGKGARTVWVGDVLIGADAIGTDSYEQNRNLVLSDGTRADSIPNLEIKTGDIAGAGHASATGRFDDEQLFYLQSRGINELDARRLVVMGFLVDVVSKIDDAALVAELTSKFQQKLSQTVEA
ncbi:MAG: Fe-S cluster assembly protein SufD [Pontimonas sp.]|nr:Fe-S cluster assembly protein SufD [Pontimonas sp.]